MARTLAEADAQAVETPDDVARLPSRLLDRLHPREPLEERPERGLELEATEGRTEAEVDPGAEAQMRVRRPAEVELVGLVEHRGITVGRSEDEPELGPARDRRPVELERFEDPTLEQLQRCVEPQQLLHRGRKQAMVGAQPQQLVGV